MITSRFESALFHIDFLLHSEHDAMFCPNVGILYCDRASRNPKKPVRLSVPRPGRGAAKRRCESFLRPHESRPSCWNTAVGASTSKKRPYSAMAHKPRQSMRSSLSCKRTFSESESEFEIASVTYLWTLRNVMYVYEAPWQVIGTDPDKGIKGFDPSSTTLKNGKCERFCDLDRSAYDVMSELRK